MVNILKFHNKIKLLLCIGMRNIPNMQQQIRIQDLTQRAFKTFDEIMREVGDKSNGVQNDRILSKIIKLLPLVHVVFAGGGLQGLEKQIFAGYSLVV